MEHIIKKGGGKKNVMLVNGSRRSTRNSKPSVRKSAVIKDQEDAIAEEIAANKARRNAREARKTAKNIANAEKKARRNARDAKKSAKAKLAANVNELGNLFSGASLKAKPKAKTNANDNMFANLFKGLNVKK
jgi:citrate lyase beta subunit